MKIVITGGTGFLGKGIISRGRSADHEFIVLTRRPGSTARPGVQEIAWPGTAALPPHEAALNLAGESISNRWTPAVKQEILDSRVNGTRRLIDAFRSMSEADRPKVLVNASAVGYYADRGEELLTEDSAPGDGFLAEVCKQWEAEAVKAEELGIRVVRIRIGVVLGEGGGALARMLLPFKMGVGGPLGSGKQWFPWVHSDDVAGLFLFSVENSALSGPVNAVSPGIVRGKEFAQELGKALHRPALLPMPVFALRIVVGEFAKHLVESQHITPSAAVQAGYQFQQPDLAPALASIVSSDAAAA